MRLESFDPSLLVQEPTRARHARTREAGGAGKERSRSVIFLACSHPETPLRRN